MNDKIILVGGGGHCRACIDVIEQENRFEIAGIVERCEAGTGKQVLGYPVLGTDDDLATLKREYRCALITVGQIKSFDPRKRLFGYLLELGFELPVIVSPLAHVSKHALLGQGTIIMHHALVNAGARVGANCIINSKAIVEHDVIIEDYCHIATGAIINGGATVGQGTFVGSNAVSLEGVAIGRQCVVGAGAKVTESLGDKTRHIK